MVLLLALGAMGTAYGAWVDDIYLTGSISTSDIDAALACGNCWEEVDGVVIDVDDTDIDCNGGSMTLNIKVTSAMEDVDYYCSFTVSNTADSLPIKIKSLELTPQGTYTGVSAATTDDLEVGDVIDPGDSATGKVHIYLTSATSAGADLDYILTVSVERWNE